MFIWLPQVVSEFQREKPDAIICLLRNKDPEWKNLVIPITVCTSYPGYKSLGYADEILVPKDFHLILAHV
jgi:hypothetical protein